MSMMAGNDLNLTATVDANVKGYERGIDQAIRANQRYEASIDRVKRDMLLLQKSLDDEANRALERQHAALTKTGRAWFMFGVAAVAALAWATNEAVKWESAWTGVTKTTNGSAAQMALLEDQLRGLSLVLPTTHQEIAAVAEAAGQLGVAREDIAAFTKVAINLGNTTNLAAEDAATSLAQFMNVMRSAPDLVDHIGNTLVALGNKGASTESQIMAMALRLAGAGELIGASEADVLGLSSAMANLGIQSELGGGAMSRVLLIIYNAVKDGGDALEGFAQLAGMSADQFARKWESKPLDALDALVGGMGRVKAGGGNLVETLADLGIKGTQNLQVVLRLAGAGDMLSKSLDQSSDAWDKNNALLKEAEKRYGTTESKVMLARNQLVDGAIDIGNVVLPALAAMVGVGADIARTWQDLPGPLRSVFVVLGIVAGAIALTGGAAMMAVPKIAAFKAAVNELEAGALKTAGTKLSSFASFLAGPWGLAIAGGITALGFFAAKHGAAAREVDAMVAALDQATGAMTEESRQLIFNKLVDEGSFSAFDELATKITRLKDLGDEAGTAMADAFGGLGRKDFFAAATGDEAAIERVRSALLDIQDIVGSDAFREDHSGSAADSYVHSVQDLLGVLSDSNGVIASSREQLQLRNEVMGDSAGKNDKATDAQKGTTQAWQEGADAAGQLTDEVQTLGEELSDLSETYLSNREAARAVREQLRGIKDAIKEYRKEHGDLDGAFKVGTKSGDEFQSMLDGLAKDYMKQIETVEKLTGSEKRVQAVYDESRAHLVAVARQMLGSKKAAEDYVDQVLQVPAVVQSHFLTPGLDDGLRKSLTYEQALKRLDGYTATTYIHTVNTGNKLAGMNAAGAAPPPPAPPTPKADGGFSFGRNQVVPRVPQIQRGGANIHWAEPETGWEAYISGKPGMEARNKAIWLEAGRRLGINDGRVASGQGTSVVERVVERYVPSTVIVSIGGEQFNGRVERVADGVVRDRMSSAGASAEMGERMYRG